MQKGEPSEEGEGKNRPPAGPPERGLSQELSSVFCLCDSSLLSHENVPLFSPCLKYVKRRDISQTNPVMSISAGGGRGIQGGGRNLLM